LMRNSTIDAALLLPKIFCFPSWPDAAQEPSATAFPPFSYKLAAEPDFFG